MLMTLETSQQISKNTQISNFMKIHPVEADLSHADRDTDRYDEAYSRFSHFANAPTKVLGRCCTCQPVIS